MGKKSKTRDEPRSRTRGEDTGTRGRGTQQRSGGRENEREERPRPQIYSYVNRKQKFLETYPFGVDGPALRMQARSTNPVVLLCHGFWCTVTCGTLLSFGLSGLGLMTTFAWLCHTLFTLVTFYLHMVPDPRREALLVFWLLPLLHGLHWAQLAQVALRGRSLSWLWGRWGATMGEQLLICQMGDFALLVLPAAMTSAYAWTEREFIALAFYDLHSQLLAEHQTLNWLFHMMSPLLVLGAWHVCCNVRVLTDVPNVCPLTFAAASFLANAPMLHFFAYSQLGRYASSVRWESDQWTVWLKPLAFRTWRAR